MNNQQNENRYCIGIAPNSSCCKKLLEYKQQLYAVNKIKNDYHKQPFIELIPPFVWDFKNEYLLIESLKKYSLQSFSFELYFNGFEKVNNDFVLKIHDNQYIRSFQKSLQYYLEIHNKLIFNNYSVNDFEPYLFMNIDIENSRKVNKIWTFLKENPIDINFIANSILLVNCSSDNYELVKEFELE
jgi:hypothetical protein